MAKETPDTQKPIEKLNPTTTVAKLRTKIARILRGAILAGAVSAGVGAASADVGEAAPTEHRATTNYLPDQTTKMEIARPRREEFQVTKKKKTPKNES